jgi:hypothetical protein
MDLSKIEITPENRPIIERLLLHAKAREDFTTFIKFVDPNFKVRKSTQRIIDFVEETRAAGKSIAIISAPPRLGKSYLSTALAAFELIKNPKAKIVLASYSADLAIQNSRRVQSFFSMDTVRAIAEEISIDQNQSAFDAWATTQGGLCRAVGAGGGLTGFGATFCVVDDPHSNLDAATSPVQTRSIHEWFSSVLMTRRETLPDGTKPIVIIIATRWSLMDLTSHVLKNYQDVALLNLPAIDQNDQPLEEEFGDFYREQKANLPSKIWSSLYQGNPLPEEGALFNVEAIDACTYSSEELPPRKNMTFIAASDYALGGQDRTCHIVAGVDSNGALWIVDIYWQRAKPEEWFQSQVEMSQQWEPTVWYEEGDTSTKILRGLRPRDYLYGKFDQYFRTIPNAGKGKEFRAHPLSRLVDTGQIRFPRNHPAWSDLLSEMISFPGGHHDDFVDACALLVRGYGQTRNASKQIPKEVRPEHWNSKETMVEDSQGRIFLNPRVAADLFDLDQNDDFLAIRPNKRIG